MDAGKELNETSESTSSSSSSWRAIRENESAPVLLPRPPPHSPLAQVPGAHPQLATSAQLARALSCAAQVPAGQLHSPYPTTSAPLPSPPETKRLTEAALAQVLLAWLEAQTPSAQAQVSAYAQDDLASQAGLTAQSQVTPQMMVFCSSVRVS